MRLLVSALMACFLLVAGLPAEEGEKALKLAVIIPLSGQLASWGTYVRHGLDLAYEQLPASAKKSLKIVYEDDQFDPKQTLSAYQRHASQEGVDAVFVVGSPTALAVAPLMEKRKQVLVAIGASDPAIVQGRNYSFIHWVIPPVLGKAVAMELVRRDFKRIAFVTAEASGAIADAQAAIEALKAMGKEDRVVYNQSFDKGQTDFRAPLQLLKKQNPDAIVMVLFPGGLSAFAKQARQLDLRAEFVGMETFEDPAEIEAAQGALLNAWYVNATDPGADFTQLYQAKFKSQPGWASANSYDALMLIGQAIAQGATDAEALRSWLANLKDYRGACGTYSASGDNRFLLPAALKRVTASGFVPLDF